MTTCEYNTQCNHYMKDSDICEEVSSYCLMKRKIMIEIDKQIQKRLKERDFLGVGAIDETSMKRIDKGNIGLSGLLKKI